MSPYLSHLFGKYGHRVGMEKISPEHTANLAKIARQMNPAERTELFEQLDVETAATLAYL